MFFFLCLCWKTRMVTWKYSKKAFPRFWALLLTPFRADALPMNITAKAWQIWELQGTLTSSSDPIRSPATPNSAPVHFHLFVTTHNTPQNCWDSLYILVLPYSLCLSLSLISFPVSHSCPNGCFLTWLNILSLLSFSSVFSNQTNRVSTEFERSGRFEGTRWGVPEILVFCSTRQ